MEVRITTLSENTAGRRGVLAEWGLSILVEVGELKVLVDTGQGVSAAYNAPRLGVDLRQVNWIVLSHGHDDHTGGLREVLGKVGPVEVIAHPDVWAAKYVLRPGTAQHAYIGLPFQRQELEGMGAAFSLSLEPAWISDNVVATGEIPMMTPYESIDPNLYVKAGDSFENDPVADDQALVVKADFGLVVILGCAHRGLINTLKYAQKLTGMEHIHTVVGGTHLFRASDEQIELTIAQLREFGIRRLGVSHCTGTAAGLRLWQEFGDCFFFNNAGSSITLP